MIVVLASRRDREARRLTAAWADHDARLMTVDDLSVAGWRVSGEARTSRVVVEGEVHDVGDITGVVTRLMTVTPEELTKLQDSDRTYAAREMSAFLGYWLSTLPCPVLNPPGAVSLCGPGWRDERWSVVARSLGFNVVPSSRLVPGLGLPSGPEVSPVRRADVAFTVVGDICVPAAAPGSMATPSDADLDERAMDATRRLAAVAGVPMLTVGFARTATGLALVGASPWVVSSDPRARDAMLGYLLGDQAVPAQLRGTA